MVKPLIYKLSVAAALLVTAVAPASAESLESALVKAYNSNPSFQAELAAVRAAHERIPEAQANWRPSLFVNSEVGKTREKSSGGFIGREETRTPRSAALTLDQPLFRGGRTVAAVSQAELEAKAQQAIFTDAEQNLLRSAATAYIDVTQAQAVLELTRKTEDVLDRQLQAVRDRLEAGDVTRTDLSQAEARTSGATARRRQAEGDLTAAKTAYRRIVGNRPDNLEAPVLPSILPTSLKNATKRAQTANPVLLASKLQTRASAAGIDLARGGLLPTLNLQAGLTHAEDSALSGDETKSATAALRLSIPLYQGGAQHARVRQAKELESQRLMQSRDVARLIKEDTVQAWEALKTARSNIESFEVQVRASTEALDGVHAEEQVGTRTILDVLDAEQELLNAEVDLVKARRNVFVAALDLGVAMGSLTAESLNLPINGYDIQGHYDKTHDRWIGTNTKAVERK